MKQDAGGGHSSRRIEELPCRAVEARSVKGQQNQQVSEGGAEICQLAPMPAAREPCTTCYTTRAASGVCVCVLVDGWVRAKRGGFRLLVRRPAARARGSRQQT